MGLLGSKNLDGLQQEKEIKTSHTILLVDDEVENLEILEGMLEIDHTVLTARNAHDAMEIVKSEQGKEIHLIISDQRMPDISGVEFLEQTIPILPNCKRMILSGFTDVDMVIEAINKGQIYKFMLKPYDLNAIRLNIQRALEAVELEEKNASLIQELQEAIKNLKLNLAQQAETEKMADLGSYVAGIVHEATTPIGLTYTASSYLGHNIEKMLKKFEDNKVTRKELKLFFTQAKESISIIRINQGLASRLIQSFKEIAVDQSSNEQRTFNVQNYIQGILLSLRPKLKKTYHQINLTCPEDLEVFSFPGALAQILTNLIMNSVIHAFEEMEDGKIDIVVTKEEKKLCLNYSDNGKGMEEDNLNKLFDPFFTTKREKGGSGMGTHIVHNIITSILGGNIDCKSKPGEGLEYIIDFPVI